MSTVTITTITCQPPLQVETGDVVTFRGYYSNSFVASDGVTPVEGGNGLSGFYYEYACTIDVNGFVVIPDITIQPTTLSNPTAGFFGQLFVNSAPNRTIIGSPQATAGWQIPTVYGSSMNFGQLALYNAAIQLLFASNSFFTQDQVIAEILSLSVGLGDATADHVPRVTDTRALTNSQITDNGVNVGIQTLNYVQVGDFQILQHGSRLEINDNFGLVQLFAGGGPEETPANEYAGVKGRSTETSAEVFVQTTGQTHLYGNSASHLTFLGDGEFDNNGTTVRVYDNDQMVSQATRNSTPVDDNIFVEEVCWFLDQSGGKLKARLRLDDGTYATAELAYTPD